MSDGGVKGKVGGLRQKQEGMTVEGMAVEGRIRRDAATPSGLLPTNRRYPRTHALMLAPCEGF